MGVLGSIGRHSAVRTLSTSKEKFVRFRSYNGGGANSSSDLAEIGQLLSKKKETYHYKPGQLFLHSIFAYRGVVVCSFNCRVYAKPKAKEAIGSQDNTPYYQVLVHKEDWADMRLAYDQTCYLTQGTTREEKVMNVINGMDCVNHGEIIPYCLGEGDAEATATGEQHFSAEGKPTPFEHDLFGRFFKPITKKEEGRNAGITSTAGLSFTLSVDQIPNAMPSQCYWLVPQAVYTEVSHGIEVRITTFYLGTNLTKGQPMHSWRYVTRLHNLERRTVIVKERHLKIFCLNNLTNVTSESLNGHHPCLTPQMPAFQFSNHINLMQPKGGHFWGKLKAEYEDGTTFEINMPTVQLEVQTDLAAEQSGNITL